MQSRGTLAWLAMVIALSASGAGWAQAPATDPPAAVQGVTVEAPMSAEARYARALNFIQSKGAPARTGQLARWPHGVCPMARGLSPEFDNFIALRVAQLATRVGAPRQSGVRCWPNVEILFTDRPQALMDLVAQQREELLGFHYVAQTARLSQVTHPVEARYLTATKGAQGDTTPDIASDSYQAGLPRRITGPVSLLDVGSTGGGCAGSRLTHCMASLLSNVLIVVDTKAIVGLRIGQVADYVAMLALTQVKSQDACDALPSILDLFSPTCGSRPKPATLTASDLAYLKALYRTDLTDEMVLEKANIANQMVAIDVSVATR